MSQRNCCALILNASCFVRGHLKLPRPNACTAARTVCFPIQRLDRSLRFPQNRNRLLSNGSSAGSLCTSSASRRWICAGRYIRRLCRYARHKNHSASFDRVRSRSQLPHLARRCEYGLRLTQPHRNCRFLIRPVLMRGVISAKPTATSFAGPDNPAVCAAPALHRTPFLPR